MGTECVVCQSGFVINGMDVGVPAVLFVHTLGLRHVFSTYVGICIRKPVWF